MFEAIGQWDLLLPTLSAALAVGAVWVGARRLSRSLSAEARADRAATLRMRSLATQTGLRVDEDGRYLHGRVDGWPVELRRTREPLRNGGVPAEQWQIRLMMEAPGRARLPAATPPPGGVAFELDGADLLSLLPVRAQDHLGAQLQWMAECANLLHAPGADGGRQTDEVAEACRSLGLRADPVLPRWSGTVDGHPVLVEWLQDRGQVWFHLELAVVLPGGLWIGGREQASAHGNPVPFPLHSGSATLAAAAEAEAVDAAQELLTDRELVGVLATHLADGRGSRVEGDQVMLVRPTMVFSVAPRQVLAAAASVATALATALERPWHRFAETQQLAVLSERAWGLAVLRGDYAGFRLLVSGMDPDGGVRVQAVPDTVALAPGLRIHPCGTRGTTGPRRRTANPILDRHIHIEADPCISDAELARLPAEVLMPLLLENPGTRISTAGVTIELPDRPTLEALANVLDDLRSLLPTLPRQRETPPAIPPENNVPEPILE